MMNVIELVKLQLIAQNKKVTTSNFQFPPAKFGREPKRDAKHAQQFVIYDESCWTTTTIRDTYFQSFMLLGMRKFCLVYNLQ